MASDELIPVPITPPPGVMKTESPRASEGRYIDTDKVRFVDGKPQKLGGWTAKTSVAMAGSPRTLHAWRDNSSQEYIGAGTYKKLYVIPSDYTVNNITPIGSSGNLTNPFSTTSGSATVSVAHTAHGRAVGDTVIFSGASAVGGITVNGTYAVTAVTSANVYTVLHTSNASSTAGPGGGTVAYQYEIAIGALFGAYGLGYGVGGYGMSTYGTARASSSLFVEPRVWSIDHFGQIMLASYNTSGLYFWDPSVSNPLTVRAAIVADAPTDMRFMLVTPERFVVAGCSQMNLKWCDQGDYTEWTPSAVNVAGIRGVTEGTKLVGGRSFGGGVTLVWTDSALYQHQYTGGVNIFDTRLVGKNCGLVSPSAAVIVGAAAYWISPNNFFRYSGGSVLPIQNVGDVWRYIFDQLNPTAGYVCAAMYNARYNEVWFFIATQASAEPGIYAIVSLADFSWAVGALTRVGGTHFAHGDTRPFWAADDGIIYLHEDTNDANGSALDATITLAPSGLDKGKTSVDIEGIEPDLVDQVGNVTLTLNAYDRIRDEDDTPQETEAFTVAPTDGLIDARTEGRYAGMTIRSNVLGGFFRVGAPTVYIRANGTRR